MPSPFAAWSSIAEIRKRIPENPHAALVRQYYDGKMWRNGAGWKGPVPQDAPTEQYTWFMNEVARSFTSTNKVKEVSDRKAAGAVGKEPTWGWTPRRPMKKDEEPNETEQPLIDELSAVTDWYNTREVHELLEEVVVTAITSEAAIVRFYVPIGFLEPETALDEATGEEVETGEFLFTGTTLAEALDAIYLEHIKPPDDARQKGYNGWVHTDPKTKRKAGIYLYKELDEHDKPTGSDRCELVYVDPATKKTVIRTIGGDEPEPIEYDLGGRLTIYMIEQRRFVSTQILEQQDSINLGLTMLPRGMTLAGFVELTFLGAQAPGEWEYDDTGKPIPGTFTPAPYKRGAGQVGFVQGERYEETDPTTGGVVTKVTNPSLHVREPSSLMPVIEGNSALYREILCETDQLHFLLADQAEASGYSKSESRAEYIRSVRKLIRAVNAFGRWLIETPVAIAEDLLGKPGKWTKVLRCDFNCRPDFGPISPDEARMEMEAGDKQYKARSTVQSALGVDDTEAESTEIASQPDAQLAVREQQGVVAGSWTAAGAPLEVATWLAGVRPDDLEGLAEDMPKIQKVIYGNEETPTTGLPAEDDDPSADPNAPPPPGPRPVP